MASVSVLAEGDPATVVCERCDVADAPLRRLRGLLGRGGLGPDEGILLRPAPAIHTWFMRFAIDAIFLDKELKVVGVSREVRPWRFARARGAHSVIELAAGESRRLGIVVGERFTLAEHSSKAALSRASELEGQMG